VHVARLRRLRLEQCGGERAAGVCNAVQYRCMHNDASARTCRARAHRAVDIIDRRDVAIVLAAHSRTFAD
jgi:thiamine monophosphate synthase